MARRAVGENLCGMAGIFITLEGIDGCGKSTQIEMLADALARRGVEPVVTREPGGTVMGERIRRLLSEAGNSMAAETELLLIVAARAQHVREIIGPALEAGRVVISDRYTDSSVAFQGYGRGLDLATIDEMNRFATGGLTPDLTILFDLDPARARARLDRRTRSVAPDAADSDLDYLIAKRWLFTSGCETDTCECARGTLRAFVWSILPARSNRRAKVCFLWCCRLSNSGF